MHEGKQVLPSKTSVLCECLFEVRTQTSDTFPLLTVMHRINVKLGGINTIPDPRSVQILTDPQNPTIVMGVGLPSISLFIFSEGILTL